VFSIVNIIRLLIYKRSSVNHAMIVVQKELLMTTTIARYVGTICILKIKIARLIVLMEAILYMILKFSIIINSIDVSNPVRLAIYLF
jgi:hypothetical protein